MFERRLYYHIDWALLLAILALCGLGVAMIYSTTADPTRGDVAPVHHAAVRHRARPDRDGRHADARLPHVHRQVAPHLHRPARAARSTCCSSARCRWARGAGFRLGGFNLQPSEFAKVGVALVLAKFFGENRGTPAWTDLAIGGVLTLIPLALIAKEPDLGTAVTLLPVFLAIAYLAGMRMRILGMLFLLFAPRGAASRGSSRSRTIRNRASRRFSIRRRMRKAPATSRSRRASRSDRAD